MWMKKFHISHTDSSNNAFCTWTTKDNFRLLKISPETVFQSELY